MSWDTASSSKDLANYSAWVVVLKRSESFYLLDVVRERLEYPQLRRRVTDMHKRWVAYPVEYDLVIENKGSGQSLIQDLREHDIYPIAVEPNGNKIMRMAAQAAKIEAGAVHLPREAAWLDDFKKEILAFPAAKNDNQVDAFSQALNRASQSYGATAYVGTYGL